MRKRSLKERYLKLHSNLRDSFFFFLFFFTIENTIFHNKINFDTTFLLQKLHDVVTEYSAFYYTCCSSSTFAIREFRTNKIVRPFCPKCTLLFFFHVPFPMFLFFVTTRLQTLIMQQTMQ